MVENRLPIFTTKLQTLDNKIPLPDLDNGDKKLSTLNKAEMKMAQDVVMKNPPESDGKSVKDNGTKVRHAKHQDI